MRLRPALPVLLPLLFGAVLGCPRDDSSAVQVERSASAQPPPRPDAGPAADGGDFATSASQRRPVPPLEAARGARPPSPSKRAWVLKNRVPSPESHSVDARRTAAARYVKTSECPGVTREALPRLRIKPGQVHSCEARSYEVGGQRREVALLLYGEPTRCGEGCVYERKTVFRRPGARAFQTLPDVFFLDVPSPLEALPAALAGAGIHLRQDTELPERVACEPAPEAWHAQAADGRWGWEMHIDGTCRVLAQVEPRVGGALGAIYEVKVKGRAFRSASLGEEWRGELQVRPTRRFDVRLRGPARLNVEGPAPELLSLKEYDRD